MSDVNPFDRALARTRQHAPRANGHTASAHHCQHCSEKDEIIAHLQEQLGERRKAGGLLKLNRAFGLTPSEAAIVLALAANSSTVLAPHAIVDLTQEFAIATRGDGDPDGLTSRSFVSAHICNIRRKLGHQAVMTLRGRGYALSQEARARIAEVLGR